MKFWPGKKTPLPAMPEPEPIVTAVDLKDSFREAVYGNQCRTRTYHSAVLPGQSEWMEARRTGNEWSVLKKIRTADHPSGGPVVSQNVIIQGLTFFDAVEYLARYEVGQAERILLNINESEIQALGTEHFIAFAEREGIVFDLNGQPHPTEDGQIVTNGQFAEEKFTAARAALQGKTRSLQNLSLPLLDGMDDLAFERIKDQLDHIDGIILAMKGTISLVEEARNDCSGGKDNIVQFIEKAILSGDSSIEDRLKPHFKMMLKLCNEKQFHDFYIPEEILPAVYLFKYQFYVFEAANIRHQVRAENFLADARASYSEESFERFMTRAENMLEILGYHSGTRQKAYSDVTRLVQVMDTKAVSTMTKNMRLVVGYLTEKRTQLDRSFSASSQKGIVKVPDFQKLLPSP